MFCIADSSAYHTSAEGLHVLPCSYFCFWVFSKKKFGVTKGFDVFCSYAIVLVVTNPGKEKSVCPLLLRLHVRAHFNKRVKEQQPKSRGWLWVSGPLCKLIASGGLLGEEKGMMPHLATSRRDTMLTAAEITWFSYFFSEGFVSKCTNRVGSLTYCNLQHN